MTKINKQRMQIMQRKQTKKQTGGVIPIGKESDKAFRDFFIGSTIKFLSLGTTGIVFTCVNNRSSDYYAFRPNNLATQVNRIILKLVVLHGDINNSLLTEITGGRSFNSINANEFNYELNIQNDIVNATCGFFEPSAPTILHAFKINVDFINGLESKTRDTETRVILTQLNQAILSSGIDGLRLGMVVMEHAGITETFIPMYTFVHSGIDDQTKKYTEAMGIYEMLALGYNGFYHGDPHGGNFLYSDDSTSNYFVSEDGRQTWYTGKRLLPIDFGRANRLDGVDSDGNQEIDVYAARFENFAREPTIANLRLCIQMIIDGGYEETHQQDLVGSHPVYEWFRTNDPEIASYVQELMSARGRSIRKTIEATKQIVYITLSGVRDMNSIKPYIRAQQMNTLLTTFT